MLAINVLIPNLYTVAYLVHLRSQQFLKGSRDPAPLSSNLASSLLNALQLFVKLQRFSLTRCGPKI